MRKSYYLILAACALMATACQNNTENIQKAAQGYLEAMGNYRPTDARQFATPETGEVTLAFYEYVIRQTDPRTYANNMPATITLGDIAINDTTATVSFHKSTPITQQDGSISLVKRKGQWLVHEIIEVPAILNPQMMQEGGRKFTDEQIHEMRRNGRHNGEMLKKESTMSNS